MEINQMTINYYTEPLGYDLSDPVFRYQVTDQSKAVFHALEVALDADFQAIVSQVPKQKLAAYRFPAPFQCNLDSAISGVSRSGMQQVIAIKRRAGLKQGSCKKRGWGSGSRL